MHYNPLLTRSIEHLQRGSSEGSSCIVSRNDRSCSMSGNTRRILCSRARDPALRNTCRLKVTSARTSAAPVRSRTNPAMLLEKDPLRLPIRQDHHAAERKDTTSWPSFAQTWPDPKMPLLAGVVFNLRAPNTVRGGVRICRWSTISRSGGALTTSGAPIGSIEKFYRE